ncbi:hypothetical protein ACFL3G_09835 [Planctomycetota bacterium]
MNARKLIKKGHEKSVINKFVDFYSSNSHQKMSVTKWSKNSESFDALIKIGDQISWVEHADIYRSNDEAREEYSYITPGEHPCPHSEHPIVAPDSRIATAFVQVLEKKLIKQSYSATSTEYGKGFLLLTERDPGFCEDTLEEIRHQVRAHNFSDCGFFRCAYIGYRLNLQTKLCFEKIYL